MKNYLLAIMLLLTGLETIAQNENNTNSQFKGTLQLSGYAEIYYAFDVNNPENNTRPSFIYSHNRHNEFNLNLGYIKTNYTAERIRGNFAIMAGTYANANLATESGVMKNIFEANAGFKIARKKELWLDAGIFASHIGFESAIGKDCWNLTRSILADNSPYYESGAKLTYVSDNEKLTVGALILNGWQRIQRVNGNSLPSFGWQITGKPNDKTLINSSSFIGTDKPDNTRQMRYFHNLYGIFNITSKFGLIVGFDAGMEQVMKKSSNYNVWYSPVVIGKFSFTNKISASARVEYYSDVNAVIISSGTPNGFTTLGYSLNVDYSLVNNLLMRIEGRLLHSTEDEVFIKRDGTATILSPTFAVSISYAFAHDWKIK